LTEKANLDVDRKKTNWILTKKMHNYVLKKIKKKKGMTLNTVLTPTPLQTPPHNPHRSGVCVSTTVSCNTG
jgi:actin-related protein